MTTPLLTFRSPLETSPELIKMAPSQLNTAGQAAQKPRNVNRVSKNDRLDRASGSARSRSKAPGEGPQPPGPQSSMPRLNMGDLPTEILQMICGELISTPACHTFKVKMGNHPKEGTKWAVHLWAKEGSDTSAYLRWKQLLRINNMGFQMAFRRFVKHVQPVELRLLGQDKLCRATAAIDETQDLVILEMDRGKSLPWFEHNTSHNYSMDGQLIQERMRHFRRVAIHYKFGQQDRASEGAFLCLCHGANQPHDDYKACPLTLACFLDLFQNLEQFYFVVDAKLVWHKKFVTHYHGMYIQNYFVTVQPGQANLAVQMKLRRTAFESELTPRVAPKLWESNTRLPASSIPHTSIYSRLHMPTWRLWEGLAAQTLSKLAPRSLLAHG